MLEATTVKHELHRIIESLDDERAEWLLDYLNNLLEPDVLTPEEELAVEEGRAEIARGEFITGEELRRKYDL